MEQVPAGVKVRQARKSLGLNQQALADAVGVTREAVSLWEKGTTQPHPRRWRALANALQIELNDLFGAQGIDSMGVAEPGALYGGPEAELLAAWRNLSLPDRALALRLIRGLIETGDHRG